MVSDKKSDKPLLTPGNTPVKTRYEALAERLVKDLMKYGEDPTDPISIVAFHYAMIDFFAKMPRIELEHSVAIGLDKNNDWTFNCPTADPEPMMNWYGLFGLYSPEIVEEGKKWLSTLNLMQLCAVCVIGKLIESVNIPHIIATKLDNSEIKPFAEEVVSFYTYISVEDLTKSFNNFIFYFSLDGLPKKEKDPSLSTSRTTSKEESKIKNQGKITRFFKKLIGSQKSNEIQATPNNNVKLCHKFCPVNAIETEENRCILLETGRYDEAIKVFNQVLEVNPRSAATLLDRGNAHVLKGDINQAILDYTEAIRFDPQNPQAYNNRGNQYEKKGAHERSIS